MKLGFGWTSNLHPLHGKVVMMHNNGWRKNWNHKFCSHFACAARATSHGLCSNHQLRVKRHGNPYTVRRHIPGQGYIETYELPSG